VIQTEGAAVAALLEAHIVVKDVLDAFDLLLNPLRLAAGLRTREVARFWNGGCREWL